VSQAEATKDAVLDERRSFLERVKGGPTWGGFFVRYGMVWALIVLAILANFMFSGFFNPENLSNLLYQVAATGIVAVGMTFAIISGGFDLSVGAVLAGASCSYAWLSQSMPLWQAFALTVVMGIVAGIINGLVVTKLKVNAFIATLATSSLYGGMTLLFTQGAAVMTEAEGFTTMGQGTWFGIWIQNYIVVGFILVFGFVLAKTPYGRSVYAVGGNLEAARLAGMRIDVVRVSTYAITGMCAAVAGTLLSSMTGVGQSNIGLSVTLDSIAIVIIGGTSLMGGEGAMWRTVVGLLMWGTIGNVFASLALPEATQSLLQGGILLVAVALDSLARTGRN